MGFKDNFVLGNGLEAVGAYGRFERVLGVKDGPITCDFSWWANQDKATERGQTIKEETVIISPEDLEANPDLKTAYDGLVTEIYKHSKAVKFSTAEDVL